MSMGLDTISITVQIITQTYGFYNHLKMGMPFAWVSKN